MRRARLAAVAAALAAAACVVFWRTPPPVIPAQAGIQVPGASATVDSPVVPAPDSALPHRAAAAPADSAITALHERLERSSLRGTRRDGGYTLGADGRLQLDAALVRAFDYWLSLTGELPDADIRALLLADVRESHGEAVAAQVEAAFERYLGLRAQLASMALSDDLATRLDQLRAARRAWFGADAEAMFGAEEAEIAYTLERQRLQTSDLAPDEREAALDALERSRPPAARAAQTDASAALIADEQSRQLDALGADPAQRQAEREALWGTEAARRLAHLDAERAAWEQRVADYLRDRAHLPSDQAAVLRAARFTPEERARIEALEAIGALRTPHSDG